VWARLDDPRNLLNLPNLLTIFRIFLVPLMAICLAYDGDQPPFEKDWMFRFSAGRVASFIVFIAGITDLLDGYIARKWKVETLLGKFLDPVADKLLLMVGLVMLMKLDRVNEWLVILLLSRELLITALRGVAAGENIIIAAGQSGKLKLIFQMLGLGFLMWYGSAFGLPAWRVGTVILYIALVISLVSGFLYLRDFWRALSEKRSFPHSA
ncbi:MAG: CDP-diacylglycerol--glycerol-3-phosphate 3-phosphatidyltransferase, partial [Deltaproteobacteria bacterium]|nr:CDP-diacylglycerol--glycerol-3-phosphate 3-phosphatidyltransferase [Deltaproteobacteria bacterium]